MAIWIPLIALAAGAGLAAAGAEKSKNAMNKATALEMMRQRKFREQGQHRFAESLQESTPEKAQSLLQEGQQMSLQRSEQLQGVPLTTGAPPQGDGVTQVRDAAEAQRGNKARAALAAQPWWTLNQAIKDIRAGQDLSMVGNFARGSQNVLPLELDHASHAGDTLAGIGQLVSTLGSLYGIGSMMSAPTAAGVGAGATAPIGGAAMSAFPAAQYGLRGMKPTPLNFGF